MSRLRLVFEPGPATEQSATRLLRHIEWSEGFSLCYLLTVSPPQAHMVQEKLQQQLGERGQTQQLLRPKSPEQLKLMLKEVMASKGHPCIWVEAIRGDTPLPDSQAWHEAWMQFILRTNERRELLRTLDACVVLVAPTGLKEAIRGAGPDLWSVRSHLFELPAAPLEQSPNYFLPRLRKPPTNAAYKLKRAQDLIAHANKKSTDQSFSLFFAEYFQVEACAYNEALTTNSQRLERLEKVHNTSQLAEAYGARASILGELGRQPEAVEAAQIEVRLLPQGGASPPRNLVTALVNLGAYLHQMDENKEAVAATTKALHILRDLQAPPNDGSYLDAQVNLGSQLSQLGRYEESLLATQEAVRTAELIASEYPDAMQTVMPTVMQNLGFDLSLVGRLEEAVAATQNAVAKARSLAKHQPDFHQDLAHTLAVLGRRLGEDNQLTEAEQAAREALELMRELLADHSVSPPHLAWVLDTLGQILLEQQKYPEAAATFREGLLYTKEHAQLRNALQDGLREACEAGDLPLPNQIPVAD